VGSTRSIFRWMLGLEVTMSWLCTSSTVTPGVPAGPAVLAAAPAVVASAAMGEAPEAAPPPLAPPDISTSPLICMATCEAVATPSL
jgi:hypothetical protein